MAHYDLLAECMTKLMAQRPEWVSEDVPIGKQDIMDSTLFVDYDKIDQIEQEEEESQQIMTMQSEEADDPNGVGGKPDTLTSNSRVKSKEVYTSQENHIALLDKLEQTFEKDMVQDLYETVANQFKIEIGQEREREGVLQDRKFQNDKEIERQESANKEGESFKDEFHAKLHTLRRDLQQKRAELESLKQISGLESQKLKDVQAAQRSDQEIIIQDHQAKLADLTETLNTLIQHLDSAESNKNLEVSRC